MQDITITITDRLLVKLIIYFLYHYYTFALLQQMLPNYLY